MSDTIDILNQSGIVTPFRATRSGKTKAGDGATKTFYLDDELPETRRLVENEIGPLIDNLLVMVADDPQNEEGSHDAALIRLGRFLNYFPACRNRVEYELHRIFGEVPNLFSAQTGMKDNAADKSVATHRKVAERADFGDRGHLMVVTQSAGESEEYVMDTLAALQHAGAPLYRMNDILVVVLPNEEIPQKAVMAPELQEIIRKYVNFQAFDPGQKKFVKKDPRAELAGWIMNGYERWHLFPTIEHIVSTPILVGENLDIVDEVGHNAETKVFVAKHVDLMIPLSQIDPATGVRYEGFYPVTQVGNIIPTKESALFAFNKLQAFYSDFAFADNEYGSVGLPAAKHSESAMIALLMHSTTRQMYDVVPGYIGSGPYEGDGKTTGGNIPVNVATGVQAKTLPPMTGRLDDMDKEFTATYDGWVLDLQAFLRFENYNDQMCNRSRALPGITSPLHTIRQYGKKKNFTTKNIQTHIFDGLRAMPRGEMCRRTIVCFLNSSGERKDYKIKDIERVAIRDRGTLIGCVFTIIRAYHHAADKVTTSADRTKENTFAPDLANFDLWSKHVRHPLLWLGAADPIEFSKVLRSADPASEALMFLLRAWVGDQVLQVNEGTAPTSAQLLVDLAGVAGQGSQAHQHLREALFNFVAGKSSREIDMTWLGRRLGSNRGRVTVDGLMIEKLKTADNQHASLWRVVRQRSPG